MSAYGELFPGPKLRKESAEDAGVSDPFLRGTIDLDAGVIRLSPPRPQPDEAEDDD